MTAGAQRRLTARPVHGDEATSLVARFEHADPTADLSTSTAWNVAAGAVRGESAVQRFALIDGDRQIVGLVALERRVAGWRSGSPGAALWTWPMAELGYEFRPRWRPECAAIVREHWQEAVADALAGERLELPRTAAAACPAEPSGLAATPGPAVWTAPAAASADAWLHSLQSRHRRDLGYYRRRIDRGGGVWRQFETEPTADLDAALAISFQLHGERIATKGQRSAYLQPPHRAFLQRLAHELRETALRLTILSIDGAPAGSCLSFCYAGRYQAYMPGWSPAHHKLDLGRQIIAHQIQHDLDSGIHEISLLGGDLAYKRELGLEARATQDLVRVPSRPAELRQWLAPGVLRAYRGARAVVRTPLRQPAPPEAARR
ncbi:MAG: GNAT family N-acetyltransferase [Planctomycetota bacterium]